MARYTGDEVRKWRIETTGRRTSSGVLETTLDDIVSQAVDRHELGCGYTTQVRDEDGTLIVELYSNGGPQLGAEVRDLYAILATIPTRRGERRRYRVFKAL